MITIVNLKEYEEFRGDDDGFFRLKVDRGINLTSGKTWYLIRNLAQDIRLIQKNVAAESYAKEIEQRVKESCDSPETVEFLKNIAAKGY